MPTIFEQPQAAPSAPGAQPAPADISDSVPMMPLTAFARKPRGVHFETQEKEETVELFLRQHPIVNIPWLILTGILVTMPSLFPVLLRMFELPFTVPPQYLIVGTLFWYIATFGFVLTSFLHWYFNIYIVTNERIVDIDFMYLLYKHFAVAELHKIQDISFAAGGVFAAIFDYGDVFIQTASEVPTIRFEKVPKPHIVVETIRDLTEIAEGGKE
ncbi:hypothetical protein A2Z33_07545 [Candidatus Gottesmanbacteria bacterium RBG_16_52_11]|uniref:DUF304 domain-containing protein n=1 Tax=Candidatus Gottesmanbacteria bacterium RBG_16_52_11 TaxID=1798374 RepID=A0A1F5YND9_9BACT|nr:MAG: hypothetical protein A2Z33_07545 [Candidatus Gottesmanbacteria bacterium RBG_16_52_11]